MSCIFLILKKEFSFLKSMYGFKLYDYQSKGSYYYTTWTNHRVKIKILYDCGAHYPVKIFIYDADSLGTIYDVTEYFTEFVVKFGTPRKRLLCAAEWLKKAIEHGNITI